MPPPPETEPPPTDEAGYTQTVTQGGGTGTPDDPAVIIITSKKNSGLDSYSKLMAYGGMTGDQYNASKDLAFAQMSPEERCAALGVEANASAGIDEGNDSQYSNAPAENPNASSEKPWYENAEVGKSAVSNYNDAILQAAAKLKFGDIKLVKAIMYMETSHGNYVGLGNLTDALGISKSVLPMNINVDFWGDKFGTRAELNTPIGNVAGGIKMLQYIKSMYPNASISQIATLYNNIHATKISDYGARVQAIYEQEAWKY